MTLTGGCVAPRKLATNPIWAGPTPSWESFQTMPTYDTPDKQASGTDNTDAQPAREGYKVVLRGDSGFIFSERELAETFQRGYEARTGTDTEIVPATIEDPKRTFADDRVAGGDSA